MEVLMHEASNRQENNASVCIVEPKSTSKRREDGTPSDATHNNGKEPVDIIFENITYTVSQRFKREEKEILHGISGRLPSKQLIALMGPSGAGKSTLLDILSGFRTTGVDGSIYINGRIRHLNNFRKCSAYITQDDRLEPLLTVIENMRVAADLKLPSSTPKHKKEMIIEDILTTLGLYEHMSTRSDRLSGGQKKRLSIALELVNNPTVMFLDEPTTGLDSSSCMQVVNLLKILARQGRTIICTIHQPSASLFQLFDQVYVLTNGDCLYQGATSKLLPYLENMKLPCPMYHNPADYIIELACGEYGFDKINTLIMGSQNGRNLQWFDNPETLKDAKSLRAEYPLRNKVNDNNGLHATNLVHQIKILLRRGFIMCKRDTTLTHLRIAVNILVGVMLGTVFLRSGADGSRVLDNYNLLFAILIHHMMTTMMLTVVTFPMQMSILLKEHFNRWYSLKAFYTAITLIDVPISIMCCVLFSIIVYFMSAQPWEIIRFSMFLAISLLIMFIGQGTGLMIGAVFNVVNGTFIGPTLACPLMMFAGFGVSLRDLPSYLKWGSYISYLRYGLEGFVGAIYGLDRPILDCKEKGEFYCHYKYPSKFLSDISMRGDQFWNDIIALATILLITRCSAYLLLRWKLMSYR
ncbi:ATP-binding cassette sub-family G member 4 [Trachymyrmex septentrionalis]|uniref:ATP-binding cassette sub-family G member 4 n=1 Tax=Trachymyrmex septentrionalis TaxID=34720 RepID=A0A151JZL1_9HYME|nr:PREDICTED: ATP-binding cassette sub-family G member 4 [Trachymyrmex septentrionalis]XP_018338601.1 PREDICTED: ATP-binding cassette sub-family G member 4 [Trachymyrmex septentrionalis]XP_018338602.1 PREDICTED: ATP-binding cassette sub-family G member 4 [Trachymyrmex septentrionalis]KYN41879.1 ATP-binding cassette sub-family G member 4 [Trachymyrmex septentrionalis]